MFRSIATPPGWNVNSKQGYLPEFYQVTLSILRYKLVYFQVEKDTTSKSKVSCPDPSQGITNSKYNFDILSSSKRAFKVQKNVTKS